MSELNRKDRDILEHIESYCLDVQDAINRFGKSYEIFKEDRDYYKSVSMSVYQIAELTIHLSDEFKKDNKGFEWQQIKGMRNQFANGYVKMDPETIWNTAINDIPDILSLCEEIRSL